MPARDNDLNGSAPDAAPAALLIIDMINALDFDGGAALLERALPAAKRIRALKDRANRAGISIVYANDNFGRWRSDLRAVVETCCRPGVRGRPLVELLRPDATDYFVVKPKHSGFFSTTLDLLLRHLQPHTLILTGIATDICVLFTANDAYMRDYKLIVPADCVAAETRERDIQALELMRRVLKADTRPSEALDVTAVGRGTCAGPDPSPETPKSS